MFLILSLLPSRESYSHVYVANPISGVRKRFVTHIVLDFSNYVNFYFIGRKSDISCLILGKTGYVILSYNKVEIANFS